MASASSGGVRSERHVQPAYPRSELRRDAPATSTRPRPAGRARCSTPAGRSSMAGCACAPERATRLQMLGARGAEGGDATTQPVTRSASRSESSAAAFDSARRRELLQRQLAVAAHQAEHGSPPASTTSVFAKRSSGMPSACAANSAPFASCSYVCTSNATRRSRSVPCRSSEFAEDAGGGRSAAIPVFAPDAGRYRELSLKKPRARRRCEKQAAAGRPPRRRARDGLPGGWHLPVRRPGERSRRFWRQSLLEARAHRASQRRPARRDPSQPPSADLARLLDATPAAASRRGVGRLAVAPRPSPAHDGQERVAPPTGATVIDEMLSLIALNGR